MTTPFRPLSPHLQIYRFSITMATSIIQRATGIAMYAGMVLLAAWLVGAAVGNEAFDTVNAIYGSWFGQLVLFGFTWTLFQHLLGGLRHFAWDRIIGMEPGQREALAWANVIGAIVLTLLAWAALVWL